VERNLAPDGSSGQKVPDPVGDCVEAIKAVYSNAVPSHLAVVKGVIAAFVDFNYIFLLRKPRNVAAKGDIEWLYETAEFSWTEILTERALEPTSYTFDNRYEIKQQLDKHREEADWSAITRLPAVRMRFWWKWDAVFSPRRILNWLWMWRAQYRGGIASLRQLWESTAGVRRPEVIISLADAGRTDSIHYTVRGPENYYLVDSVPWFGGVWASLAGWLVAAGDGGDGFMIVG
jgi:hypothetical protein